MVVTENQVAIIIWNRECFYRNNTMNKTMQQCDINTFMFTILCPFSLHFLLFLKNVTCIVNRSIQMVCEHVEGSIEETVKEYQLSLIFCSGRNRDGGRRNRSVWQCRTESLIFCSGRNRDGGRRNGVSGSVERSL